MWSDCYFDDRDRRSHHTRTKRRAQDEKVSWAWEEIKEVKTSWTWEEIMAEDESLPWKQGLKERREYSEDAGVRVHKESPKDNQFFLGGAHGVVGRAGG